MQGGQNVVERCQELAFAYQHAMLPRERIVEAALTMSQDLDSLDQDQLRVSTVQRLKNVVHDTSESQPCREGNADAIILDAGKEETDGVYLGSACLVEGVVTAEVRVHGGMELGVCPDHAGQR